MKEQTEKISSGATFEGAVSFLGLIIFVIGFFSSIAGIISEPGIVAPALLVAFFGLVLFLQIKGVIIDHTNRKVRPYRSYLLFKTGEWEPLDKYSHVTINPSSMTVSLNSRSRSRQVHVKHYDVHLFNLETEESLFLYSFDKLPEADKFMRKYSAKLNLPVKELPKIAPHARDKMRKQNA
jgi:hypothetical protein